MSTCRLCHLARVEPLLDLGEHALCNRFLSSPTADEAAFPFTLGQCGACGVVQLLAPVAAHELKPRFDWIVYREPEGHLDDLVDGLCRLPGVSPTSVVGGISMKDDSTLERFRKRGLSHTWRIDVEHDLGADDHGAGPETVQRYLTPETAGAIAERRGAADVLVARHVVEHAHEPATFVAALRRLVKADGYVVLEAPDCGPALRRADYTMPWEEHVLYFTEDLLRQAVGCWGLSAVGYALYPYSHENSLVAIVRSTPAARSQVPDSSIAESTRALGQTYARRFPAYRRRANDALTEFRRARGGIAVFGAGHLSCAWINFLGARDHIDFVADDDPRKRGLFMPGSRLPILASAELVERGIKLCLLSLSQESEARVIAHSQGFLESGGTFASIFPGRPNSLVP
ncbi:MAG TPA: SAM-dependent methyltransferase [Candidatus Rokubacteria bacterium]|nr:SAM-dependent methyltransferase [Candidatus Rokubacteria bacterium]HJW76276.1 class I SAM-dependent methyltransferase [Thermoleophilia bacterium]